MRIVWAVARVLPVLVERLLLIQDTLGYTGLHFNFSTLPAEEGFAVEFDVHSRLKSEQGSCEECFSC